MIKYLTDFFRMFFTFPPHFISIQTSKFLFLCSLFALITFSCAIDNSAHANPKYSSIILEESTGKVLFSRNADKKLYPASLTKIMTLYLIFEALQKKQISLSTPMKVSSIASSRSPSKLYLRPNQVITVKNAILALVTKSANDVATVVAEHLSGSEKKFAKKMTRKARALGMKNTIFKNASGLPNRSQVSTARDMSKLAISIRKDFPKFYHYFSRTSFVWKGHKFKNHNKLLSSFNGTDGIKTGYTSASGFNLVTSTERMGIRLIGVVFGYYVIAPLSINFLGSYQVSQTVANQISLTSFVSTVTTISLANGIIFELPILVYFLTKIGLLTPEFMRTYRRHAMVVTLILSAIITPPDITSQILVSFPLIILYEISIQISKSIIRKNNL